MQPHAPDKTARIRALNDVLRTTFLGGRVLLSAGVAALPDVVRVALVHSVMSFNDFTNENDPHKQHDFGAIELNGDRYFWKIDAYDQRCEFGSEDPSDPDKTTRMLTIMLADEY